MATKYSHYDVKYTTAGGDVTGEIRGATLDYAQDLAATITASGETYAITGADGFQGGGRITSPVTDVRVTKGFYYGSSDGTLTAHTETLTPTVSGQTIFALTHPAYSKDGITVTVSGQTARPYVIWDLMNAGRSTAALYISVPFMDPAVEAVSSLSVTYSYKATADRVDVVAATPTGSINGTNKIFTLAHSIAPGSLTLVTSVSATSGAAVVIEGGYKTFEAYYKNGRTKVPFDTGTTLEASYSYSLDDDAAVPSAETHSVHPSDEGTVDFPPFSS